MLEAKSLRKAKVPPSLLEHPSPGHIQSTRLALHINEDSSTCSIYIASGARIYKFTVNDYLKKNSCGFPLQPPCIRPVSMGDSLINQGKESLLIPDQTHVLDSELVDRCPHRTEIQSIVLAETDSFGNTILGSVDSFGQLIVSKVMVNGKDPDVNRIIYSAGPQDCGVGEGSWAGLCFSPTQWSIAAVARSYCKSVDVYDQDIHLRTLKTLRYPTSLSFVDNLSFGNGSSLLAVTEGCQLSLWDLRVKENSGCVHRITASVGDTLYAVSNSSNGNIAVGGADRTVTIYDPRRLTAISRWVHCSKYEITGLAFSCADSDYIYIQGVDYEVICGQWEESTKAYSFKGDSNWLGFSKCANRDILGGWCDSGSIFVADFVKKA